MDLITFLLSSSSGRNFYFYFVASTRFSLRLIERLNERRNMSYHGGPCPCSGFRKAGTPIVMEMQRNPQLGLNPVAFVDDILTKGL
ncbi:MAG: hypothetical protein IPH77_19330 [Ignavibacteria bacterium]|nr:hypothetical protein [Ignavibacteria bacterium]